MTAYAPASLPAKRRPDQASERSSYQPHPEGRQRAVRERKLLASPSKAQTSELSEAAFSPRAYSFARLADTPRSRVVITHSHTDHPTVRYFTSEQLLHSPGRSWMRAGVTLAGALTAVFLLLFIVGSPAIGFVLLWLGWAAFFFCNYATARLGYPTYIVGPAIASYLVIASLMLALTALAAALLD